MQNIKTIGVLVVILVGVVIASSVLYTISEKQQVVITQFGRHKRVVQEAGLHFKIPIIEQVNYYEKRILEWDGKAEKVPTLNKKYIWVDCFARWRIGDPLLFRTSVGYEEAAHSRLDDIINGAVRNQISNHTLLDAVRTTDRELKVIELEGEEAGEITKVEFGRDKIVEKVLAEAKTFASEKYGIDIVDIRIKRINYHEEVRDSVYQNMIAERQQMAAKYRSQGEGEAMEIEGRKERKEKEILSEAYREAEVIRGVADANAITIYAEAYSKDPEFYSFLETLKSYEANLGAGSVLILSSESDYLKYLKSWGEVQNRGQLPNFRPALKNSHSDRPALRLP